MTLKYMNFSQCGEDPWLSWWKNPDLSILRWDPNLYAKNIFPIKREIIEYQDFSGKNHGGPQDWKHHSA